MSFTKRAYIHIGLGRCASTCVQTIFREVAETTHGSLYLSPTREIIDALEYRYIKSCCSTLPSYFSRLSEESCTPLLIASEFFSCRPYALLLLVKNLHILGYEVTVSCFSRSEYQLLVSFFYKFFVHIDACHYYVRSYCLNTLGRHALRSIPGDSIFAMFCVHNSFSFFSSVAPNHLPNNIVNDFAFFTNEKLSGGKVTLIEIPLTKRMSLKPSILPNIFLRLTGLLELTSCDSSFLTEHINSSLDMITNRELFRRLLSSSGKDSRSLYRQIRRGEVNTSHYPYTHWFYRIVDALIHCQVKLYFRSLTWKHVSLILYLVIIIILCYVQLTTILIVKLIAPVVRLHELRKLRA
jgi:hypothetical protein